MCLYTSIYYIRTTNSFIPYDYIFFCFSIFVESVPYVQLLLFLSQSQSDFHLTYVTSVLSFDMVMFLPAVLFPLNLYIRVHHDLPTSFPFTSIFLCFCVFITGSRLKSQKSQRFRVCVPQDWCLATSYDLLDAHKLFNYITIIGILSSNALVSARLYRRNEV